MCLCLSLCPSVAALASSEDAGWSVASDGPVQLIELYSSQGCSSCPPAERWLTRLLDSPDLWTRVVPLNFHVTYWDRLGWPDPYAREEFTERQTRHARALGLPSAYTPGFIVSGREWRGFFSSAPLPAPLESGGALRARLDGEQLTLEFQARDPRMDAVDFHVALLGVGLCDRVAAGENRGRELRQDFVVLAQQVARAASADGDAGGFAVTAELPRATGPRPGRHALAVWVTRASGLAPLQAAGGWLDGVPRASAAPAQTSQVSCAR